MLYEREALETELRDWMIHSLNGDRAIYEKFLLRVATMLRGYLINNLKSQAQSQERAEDLVQEVLIAIHNKKHLYRTDMPILPWLFAIARYKLIDHLRADARRPSTVDWDETFDPPAPEKSKVSEEAAFQLEELLTDLSPRQREILLLAKADGIPLAQIAERFGMSLSAVKVTVHRALQKARKNT